MACVFCSEVIGKTGGLEIYNDGETAVFLDKFPRTRGHICVAPVEHHQDPFVSAPELARKVMTMVVDAGRALTEYGAKGVNIGINVGKVAGQQVPHFHVHVIPRYEAGDVVEIEPAFVDTPWRQKSIKLTEAETNEIRDRLTVIFAGMMGGARAGV
ncbi:MAG: HIT family protein [Nitrospinae bacterium]|nr:HIT family protein [Nitrospinota bacterium]